MELAGRKKSQSRRENENCARINHQKGLWDTHTTPDLNRDSGTLVWSVGFVPLTGAREILGFRYFVFLSYFLRVAALLFLRVPNNSNVLVQIQRSVVQFSFYWFHCTKANNNPIQADT